MINLWDEQRSIVASIPTQDGFRTTCVPGALYAHGRSGSDTYTIERYDFDGTLRWRRSVRFPNAFEREVAILPSSLKDVDGRASAVLNVFDYQYNNQGGRQVRQGQVRLYERIRFSFPTSGSADRA